MDVAVFVYSSVTDTWVPHILASVNDAAMNIPVEGSCVYALSDSLR